MYQEKRPTCVTVISWTWMIIGGMMFMSATMGLLVSVVIGNIPQDEAPVPLFVKLFPLLALIQMGLAVLGLVSGINFLKLKAWSRSVLEGLTWLLLIFILGFMVFWIYNWVSMTSAHAPSGFGIVGAVMGVFGVGIYAVPLGIMLRYLRGAIVKHAVEGIAEQSEGQK